MRKTGENRGKRAATVRVAAALTILLSLTALTGWALGIPGLSSIIPGSVEMKANTACALVVSGIVLLILCDRPSPGMRRLAQLLTLAVFLVGLLTVTEYFAGRTFGIDEFLFKDPVGAYDVFRGRMSPLTAAAFVATAAALFAMPHRGLRGIASVGAACAALLGGAVLVGYLWGVGEIVTDRWLPPVALNTALCFALLGVGIWLAPDGQVHRGSLAIDGLAGVEIKILSAFVVALGLLLIGGAWTYRTTVQFAESVEWVAHTQEVRAGVTAIAGSLDGAEVALRDYLLTRDDGKLREYQRLRREVQRHLDETWRLTADNPRQQANLAALRPIAAGQLDVMTNALTAFEHFGLQTARAVIAVNRRTNPGGAIRARTDAMDAEEVRLLAERQQQSADIRRITLVSLLATLALGGVLFVALFRGVHREMRARHEAEAALRASDRYSRSVLDSSPDCLCVLTLEGRVAQMTPRGRRLLDIDDPAAIQDRDWLALWSGAGREAAVAALDGARNGADGRFQASCATFKGTNKWWDVIVMPMLGVNGRPEQLLAVARDISEVKRTESELRESNRFLDSLIDNLPVMVVIKDAAQLRVVRHNSAFAQALGLPPEQLQGRSPGELFAAGEAGYIIETDREALAAGRLVEVPEQSIHTAHLGLRTFHSMKVPINDAGGAPRYLMVISVDITARRLAEQAIVELNRALEHKAAQLEASNHELEGFSYSVSHDLRAPLRAIDGFALMIEEDYSDRLEPEGRRYLRVIRDNSRHMGELIDDLLSFSRLARLPVAAREVNVGALVREVVDEILNLRHAPPDRAASAAPRIDIEELPPVRADRSLLRQVWVNLLSNAIKYSSKAPAPRIRVSGRQNDTENLYSVSDNGVGFDMNYAEKLFGVFQRLHRTDEFDGTGVGLAIVHRVVTRHGGRVWAEGRVDQGATFSFALPRESV